MADWSKLSKAWTKDFLASEAGSIKAAKSAITPAIERTLPLLQDPTAVPFVCRYRTDIIQPLTTKQIHRLSDHVQKHNSLNSLRERILPFLAKDRQKNNTHDDDLIFRVETSISKSELEDIYAPFKPPSKGSLEDRIRNEHPNLVGAVDELWDTGKTSKKLSPRDAAVTLLANRIANHVPVMDASVDYCTKHCRIQVKQALSKTKKVAKKAAKATDRNEVKDAFSDKADKYRSYFDFTCKVSYLKHYQTLAIRRGSDQQALKYTFDIDNERSESMIAWVLRNSKDNYHGSSLYRDAIHDAWTRLIRKRVTSRLWKEHCQMAEEGAIDVFCVNLSKALLAPPLAAPKPILVLDPGFKAGIKCAVLDPIGQVVSFKTVSFMGNSREAGKSELVELMRQTQRLDDDENCKIYVCVGNGHGMKEAREMVSDAAKGENVNINIEVVNEAGASVWSVTEMASKEFPKQNAAAVAAVSIGRRYQNPLNELVKIPPRSLGLGMYQHDLSEKDLDDKLTATSIDAVAEVGVNINACSSEILQKVPSLTKSMCAKIMKARPLESRSQLQNIPGIGPKTFETCAAFVRISGGPEPLDDTLVHPESYDLARWLVKKLKFELGNPKSVTELPPYALRNQEWAPIAKKAAKRFDCTEERVFTVIEHLVFSITRPDPRLYLNPHKKTKIGSTNGCSSLPSELSTNEALRKACPVRGITGTVRNVVDFGAFVDFGGDNDGLLHRSKLGNVPLETLLIGQDIGIDILGVSKFKKVSVGLSGQNLPAEDLDKKRLPSTKDDSEKGKRRRRK